MKKYFLILFFILNLLVCNKSFSAIEPITPTENSSQYKTIEKEYTEPEINSEAVLLMENKSGNILYEKNSDKILYPASTTKIMTAIIAIEKCNLNKKTVVSKNAVDLVPEGYTNAGLVAGEELSIEDLLYALMLASANEAANVLAEYISGSIEEFAILMTEKSKELGCENTNFLNANGMHDENHYTTAKDLCIIANYCFKNDIFNKIMETKKYTIPATEQHPAEDRTLTNTNALINPESKYFYEYALGGKTGFTTPAGYCLVTFAKKDTFKLTCVILNAETSAIRFSDAISLFKYGYESCCSQIIVPKGTKVDTIEIPNASRKTKNVDVITSEEILDYIPNNWSNNDLKTEINLKKNIVAPLSYGKKIGEITYILKDKKYTVDLIANSSAYLASNHTIYILLGILILVVGAAILIPKKRFFFY